MMILIDSARVILFLSFFIAAMRFFYLAWNTHKTHSDDPVVQQHFAEHSIAAALAFIGSLIGVLYSIVHLFSSDQGALSEYPFTIAMLFLLMSGTAFMVHMIREQTPGHAFYVRETTKAPNEPREIFKKKKHNNTELR